jgi:hypothetical protein
LNFLILPSIKLREKGVEKAANISAVIVAKNKTANEYQKT